MTCGMLFIVWSIAQLQRHGTSHTNPLEFEKHNITLLLLIEQIFHLEGCFDLLVWELSLHGRSRVVPAAPCSWPDPWPQQVPVAVSSFDIKSTGCRFIWILQKSYNWSQECWGKLGRGRRGSRHQSFDKVRHKKFILLIFDIVLEKERFQHFILCFLCLTTHPPLIDSISRHFGCF